MSYEFYKILHLTMIMLFFTGFAIAFYGGEYSKKFKIIGGISTLLILVSGMGLMARLGIGHTAAWPIWIKLKVLFWATLGLTGPILIKRFPQKGKMAYWGFIAIFILIVYLVNYKPE
mgnify:CR=1 FL=1